MRWADNSARVCSSSGGVVSAIEDDAVLCAFVVVVVLGMMIDVFAAVDGDEVEAERCFVLLDGVGGKVAELDDVDGAAC